MTDDERAQWQACGVAVLVVMALGVGMWYQRLVTASVPIPVVQVAPAQLSVAPAVVDYATLINRQGAAISLMFQSLVQHGWVNVDKAGHISIATAAAAGP